MSPELIDNMIQNYSSLSFGERSELWANSLELDRKTMSDLREAHNKMMMEHAEKSDPETAKKLMERVVENEDEAATLNALEDGKKSARHDIIDRIQHQLETTGVPFEIMLKAIAARFNISYVKGMDLNELPSKMLVVVAKVMEIIKHNVEACSIEGQELGDLVIPLNQDQKTPLKTTRF